MSARAPKHVIDFHTHVFPERVAARAMEALCATYEVTAVAEATPSALLQIMSESGIDAAVVAPVATRPGQVRSINEWAAGIQSKRIISFGALHPDLPDPASEVERIVALGLKGVKLQPNFQEISPDDRRLWPAYEAAQGRLIFLFHSGQEIKPLPCVHARPGALARVREAFPGLTMVIAHMGGYQMWDEVRAHLLGKNLYFDTSFCPERDLSAGRLADLVRAHGVHRVVFGTDFPWAHPAPDLQRLFSLGLSPDDLEAITWRNARDLLGLDLN
ncbi:MAG TPA: amidohydrolase family protein [Armatimonadota bacterium]|nr:amidohydrolase family protein [Armatimonadota bacterium]